VRNHLSKPLVILGLAVAALFAAYWALLFLTQRALLFPAPPASGAPARPADAAQLWLATAGGRTEAWFLPATARPAAASSLLIFSHGNGELIDHWPAEFDPPRSWGVAVLLVEYPGYGRSHGHPAEATITQTMLAAYDWARAQPGIDPGRIVAYGRSVGGGAACQLAARRPVSGLILESAFTSVRAYARGYGAPAFLVRDPFDNQAVLRQYRGPLLLLHGSHDDVTPASHSQALAAAARQAELHLLPCGHNDCPRQWPLIRAFLGRHGLLPGGGAGES
jgi:fermentation-respiration switch protein FrsA (DUF1100 family)